MCSVGTIWIVPCRHVCFARWPRLHIVKINWIWLMVDHGSFPARREVELSHIGLVLEIDAVGGSTSRIKFDCAVTFSSLGVCLVRIVQDELLIACVPRPLKVFLERNLVLVTKHVPLEWWNITRLKRICRYGRLRLW